MTGRKGDDDPFRLDQRPLVEIAEPPVAVRPERGQCAGSNFHGIPGAVSLTVNTVAPDTAFDPVLWLNRGASGCTRALADDNYPCAFAPTDGQCPALQVNIDQVGTYHAVVMSAGGCAGSTAEYELRIDVPPPANLQMYLDDFLMMLDGTEMDIRIAGTATRFDR